jgi:hypothetical protein
MEPVHICGTGALALFGGQVALVNRIDHDVTIPDGYNVVMIGPFEVGPDVTVKGEGNACFVGLG